MGGPGEGLGYQCSKVGAFGSGSLKVSSDSFWALIEVGRKVIHHAGLEELFRERGEKRTSELAFQKHGVGKGARQAP